MSSTDRKALDASETETSAMPVTGETEAVDSSSVKHVMLVGLVIALAIGLVDNLVLSFASSYQWQGWPIYVTFAVFVLQTGFLAAFVGTRYQQSPLWWVFFFWSLLQVNFQLMLIGHNARWTTQFQSAFVYAFLTAQVGTVIVWGILGTSAGQKKLIFAPILFVVCCYPFWFDLAANDSDWLVMMGGYIVASVVACGILRFTRFRMMVVEKIDETGVGESDDGPMQFSISHLLIWMIVVASLMGLGRFVDWKILGRFFYYSGISSGTLVGRSVIMTLITVVTAWAVLGDRKSLVIRIPVLLVILTAVGVGLAFIDQNSGWWTLASTNSWGGSGGLETLIMTWATWTLLNGLFISCLLLLFRVTGNKLVRRKRKRREFVG